MFLDDFSGFNKMFSVFIMFFNASSNCQNVWIENYIIAIEANLEKIINYNYSCLILSKSKI